MIYQSEMHDVPACGVLHSLFTCLTCAIRRDVQAHLENRHSVLSGHMATRGVIGSTCKLMVDRYRSPDRDGDGKPPITSATRGGGRKRTHAPSK
jgi:hypothetical protein